MKQFSVKIICKPYVKQFLLNVFGGDGVTPLDISRDKLLYQDFRNRLKKPSFRFESLYPTSHKYREEIRIKISKEDFYCYGWELSRTDMISFNRIVEAQVKLSLYAYVTPMVCMGIPLSDAVDGFQREQGYPEFVWPKESIYKDCQRNLSINKDFFRKEILNIINNTNIGKVVLRKGQLYTME